MMSLTRRIDHLGEGRADDHRKGEVHDIALEGEVAELLQGARQRRGCCFRHAVHFPSMRGRTTAEPSARCAHAIGRRGTAPLYRTRAVVASGPESLACDGLGRPAAGDSHGGAEIGLARGAQRGGARAPRQGAAGDVSGGGPRACAGAAADAAPAAARRSRATGAITRSAPTGSPGRSRPARPSRRGGAGGSPPPARTGRARSFRVPPTPFREPEHRAAPGTCCLCGQPVYRFGWHADLWGTGEPNRARPLARLLRGRLEGVERAGRAGQAPGEASEATMCRDRGPAARRPGGGPSRAPPRRLATAPGGRPGPRCWAIGASRTSRRWTVPRMS